ncbi:hypothetical protein Tco_0355604, partial [Tanacetum coccineum]
MEQPVIIAVNSCRVSKYRDYQLAATPATYYYLNPKILEAEESRTDQEKMRSRFLLKMLMEQNPESYKGTPQTSLLMMFSTSKTKLKAQVAVHRKETQGHHHRALPQLHSRRKTKIKPRKENANPQRGPSSSNHPLTARNERETKSLTTKSAIINDTDIQEKEQRKPKTNKSKHGVKRAKSKVIKMKKIQ